MATPEPAVTAEEKSEILKDIWDLMRGTWKVCRHDYTDVALNGVNIPLDSIRIPAMGKFKVIPRAPIDTDYEDEVLKTSAVHYRTRNTGNTANTANTATTANTGNIANTATTGNTRSSDGDNQGDLIGTQGERYIFRRKRDTGVWSIWDSGVNCATKGKVADFRLKTFYRGPVTDDGEERKRTYRVVLDVVTWNDEFGRNFLQMVFIYHKGIDPDYGHLEWEMRCRFDSHLSTRIRQWEDVCTFIEE